MLKHENDKHPNEIIKKTMNDMILKVIKMNKGTKRKTSKSISTKSYGNKKGIKPATADLDDTKFNLYSLQLSLYRYLLEEYYGLKIGQHMILHLKEEECIGVHTPYLKNNVLKMVGTRLK